MSKKIDHKKMLEDIDKIVGGDWGFSVTDDMVNLNAADERVYKTFTQEQAQEMSLALSKVYMIAHAVHCTACQSSYTKEAEDVKKDR